MSHPGSATIARCLFLAAWLIVCAGTAHAQEQERKLLDRIQHPNMDLHAEGFERPFETKGSTAGKQANIRPFNFGGKTPGLKAGDGEFHPKTFNDGRGTFNAAVFPVKPAIAVDRQALPDASRNFGTRSVNVREDRLANKPAPNGTRGYVDGTKPFLVPGKRQDIIDDLRAQKNLTIDQVREILNKSR